MTVRPTLLAAALLAGPLLAFSPGFHEGQTRLAKRMVPRGMSAFLQAHERVLMDAARGVGSDQPPTVEDVEEQVRRIVSYSELGKRPEVIVRELGVLAKMVQLLNDPSVTVGVSPTRSAFEAYADERLKDLVVTREAIWGVTDPLDPRPRLVAMADTKYARHRRLAECIDPASGARLGTWDRLSIPFAQLQLAYSGGIHATTNLWILLWRNVGEYWVPEHP